MGGETKPGKIELFYMSGRRGESKESIPAYVIDRIDSFVQHFRATKTKNRKIMNPDIL